MRSARIVASLFALMVVLLLVLSIATIPGCVTSTPEAAREEEQFNAPVFPNDNQEAGLIGGRTARVVLVAPIPRKALAHIPDAGKMAPEREYAVFDGILCEMVRGQWRPRPPGTPWGTHTVCISTDSGGNVTTLDFVREAK